MDFRSKRCLGMAIKVLVVHVNGQRTAVDPVKTGDPSTGENVGFSFRFGWGEVDVAGDWPALDGAETNTVLAILALWIKLHWQADDMDQSVDKKDYKSAIMKMRSYPQAQATLQQTPFSHWQFAKSRNVNVDYEPAFLFEWEVSRWIWIFRPESFFSRSAGVERLPLQGERESLKPMDSWNPAGRAKRKCFLRHKIRGQKNSTG